MVKIVSRLTPSEKLSPGWHRLYSARTNLVFPQMTVEERNLMMGGFFERQSLQKQKAAAEMVFDKIQPHAAVRRDKPAGILLRESGRRCLKLSRALVMNPESAAG